MELAPGSQSFWSFPAPASGSPASYLSFSNTNQQPILSDTSARNPFDHTLELAFSRLDLSTPRNRELGYQGFIGGEFPEGSGYGIGGAGGGGLARTRQGRRNKNVGGSNVDFDGLMMVGPDIDIWGTSMSSSYQPSHLNGNGYLLDSRTRSGLFNEFSILPSSSQNGFLAGSSAGAASDTRASNLNGNGYLYPRSELFNEFSILPSSSNQNGFAGGAGCTGASRSKNDNVIISSFIDNTNDQDSSNSFRRPHCLQEPLNCLRVGDLRGRIVVLSKDQYGCRFLQKAIDEASKEEIDMIFMEIIDHVSELMMDPFANYVVQKVVELCSEEKKNQILLMVIDDQFRLLNICLNSHGSRAVQKLLEKLTTDQQISEAMSALGPNAVALTKDMNGHRVIQYCLKNFSDEDNKYLLNKVAANCYQIATDKTGCCALQQCVDHSSGKARSLLIGEIIGNALHLAEDQYGNYVVQHILGLKDPGIRERLLRQLKGYYATLSCNRYGSNVVEKCLIEASELQSTSIIVELLGSPIVSRLLVDPFGNYVMQKALSVSKGCVYHSLVNLVKQNYEMLRSHVYGKWILRKVPSMYNEKTITRV